MSLKDTRGGIFTPKGSGRRGKKKSTGTASGLPVGFRGETAEQKAYYDKQFALLKAQLARYGITLDDSLRDNLDFKGIRDSIYGMEAVLKEFPGAAKYLQGAGLQADTMDEGAYAAASSMTNNVYLGNGLYMDYGAIEKLMKNDTSHNWHPAGSTAQSVAMHETGHLISYAVARKMGGNLSTQESKNEAMGRIVENAMRTPQVQAFMKRKGYGKAQARRSISDYAGTSYRNGSPNYNETIAEAVSDYMSNRGRANPLSQAIVREMKRQLRS